MQPGPHPSELLVDRTDHNPICTKTHKSLIAMALVFPAVRSLDHADHNLDLAAPLSSASPQTPRKSHKRSSWSHTLGELQPVAMAPERWSVAVMPTAFLENIQHVEINRTHERDGETFFVLDVFLHHFDTRLPANLTYLRRALHSTTNLGSGTPATASVKENTRPDYQIERRFIDFCDLRHQVYDAATLTPHIRCASCDEFVCYVRFKLRQPRPVAHLLTTGRKTARRAILTAFVNDFLHMALCKDKQNQKCESHGAILTALESFLRAPGSSPSSHARQ